MTVNIAQPLQIKNITTRNRIVLPPMETKLADDDGNVTGALIEHYVKRAVGGAGLIIIEHAYVNKKGKLSHRQLSLDTDECVPGLTGLVNAIRETGTPCICQISHAGAKADVKITGNFPVVPSASAYASYGSQALKIADIQALEQDFIRAAERAHAAGFDGIEIHGAHGFLLNQFASPLSNRRDDDYGGPMENRLRFQTNVLAEVRKIVGPDYPVFYRLASDDRMENGITAAEGVIMAKYLAEAGFDVLDVSGGLCGSRPPDLDFPGFFIPQAALVKKAVKVPVIGVGGINDPRIADEFIKSGKVDLVAVGRAFLKYPEWASRALSFLGYQ